jgi:hypothetical protein
VVLPEELFKGRVVMAARGKKKTLRRATVEKPSTKKKGQWTVKFDKDGKQFATPTEEIHLLIVTKGVRKSAPEALLPSAEGNMSIYWRLLRPELLTLLKDKDYGDGLDEKTGLSSDAFSLFAKNGDDHDEHDARIRVATEFLMAVQVPKVANALIARPTTQWWDGAELTVLFHTRGVNMRHIGAVWSILDEQCKKLNEEGADLERHNGARRAVLQEMYVRSAKNLLRRDLRGAMEMGAGAREIEQIVSTTFTRLSPGDDESDAYLVRAWHGVWQRFGVDVTMKQRSSVSAIRAVLRVAKAVGVRLTPSCLRDLNIELVKSEAETAGQHEEVGFTFTAADIERMAPRVKFLDSDDNAQGAPLRNQA